MHYLQKNNEIQRWKEKGGSQYNYQNELQKVCFQHVMAYGNFEDLTRKTASEKILHDKAYC